MECPDTSKLESGMTDLTWWGSRSRYGTMKSRSGPHLVVPGTNLTQPDESRTLIHYFLKRSNRFDSYHRYCNLYYRPSGCWTNFLVSCKISKMSDQDA